MISDYQVMTFSGTNLALYDFYKAELRIVNGNIKVFSYKFSDQSICPSGEFILVNSDRERATFIPCHLNHRPALEIAICKHLGLEIH